MPLLDIVEESFLLFWRNSRRIGIDHQAVIAGKRARVEVVGIVGVGQLDAARSHDRLEVTKPVGRLVVPLVAQKQDLESSTVFGRTSRTTQNETRQNKERREHYQFL